MHTPTGRKTATLCMGPKEIGNEDCMVWSPTKPRPQGRGPKEPVGFQPPKPKPQPGHSNLLEGDQKGAEWPNLSAKKVVSCPAAAQTVSDRSGGNGGTQLDTLHATASRLSSTGPLARSRAGSDFCLPPSGTSPPPHKMQGGLLGGLIRFHSTRVQCTPSSI